MRSDVVTSSHAWPPRPPLSTPRAPRPPPTPQSSPHPRSVAVDPPNCRLCTPGSCGGAMWPAPTLLLLGLSLGLRSPAPPSDVPGTPDPVPGTPPSPSGHPPFAPRQLEAAPGLRAHWGRARSRLQPRSAGPRPHAGFAAEIRCPPLGPEPLTLEAVNSSPKAMESSVSCQMKPCLITQVKISRDKKLRSVQLHRKTEMTLNAIGAIDCPDAISFNQHWEIFSVPSVQHVPDWTRPLDVPQLQTRTNSSVLHIPKSSLTLGMYVVQFVVTVTTSDPVNPLAKGSDHFYLQVVRSPLKAVLLGDHTVIISFTDGLVLDGSKSLDLDAEDPFEGLNFFWFCTTEMGHYQAEKIILYSPYTCLPEQKDLHWPWDPGPVLTLLPKTLKGNRAHYFRLVVQKDDRYSYADKIVRVLQGTEPKASISCIENCAWNLILSERMSLFFNCTNCATTRVFCKWAITTRRVPEVPFDWTEQSLTGRNKSYVAIKPFAFKSFAESTYAISLQTETWGGVISMFIHSFLINHSPELGECKINPTRGIAFVTKFVISCNNFKDKDSPLTYMIMASDFSGTAEVSSVRENSLRAILYLGTLSSTPPSFLPVGLLANQALKVYVQVYDSVGSFTQKTLYATVETPTSISPRTLLDQIRDATMGPNSLLSTLLQNRDVLSAGYLVCVVASVLNTMRTDLSLVDAKTSIRLHLLNVTSLLPLTTLEECSQAVVAFTLLTQAGPEFTHDVQELAVTGVWQVNQALQAYIKTNTQLHNEQIKTVITGILIIWSYIFKQRLPHEDYKDLFYLMESLANTILTRQVPGTETTALKSSSINVYAKKTEMWDVTNLFVNEPNCRNCFYLTLHVNSVPDVPLNGLVSTLFFEFAEDPFPWLNQGVNISADVVAFLMTGTKADGDVIDITPDVVEVYITRRDLTPAPFNLTVGPNSEPDEGDDPLKKTTGGFRFEVDSEAVKELLVHVETNITVLFTVFVYAGSRITPTALMATFLVPHDMPPSASQNSLFDAACSVKKARVICFPQSLLQVMARYSSSSRYNVSVVLQAPQFVLTPNDELVKITLFSVHCLNMDGIQSQWREDCVLGENTSGHQVHCICKNRVRTRRDLGSSFNLAGIQLRAHFLTAKVFVIPNPVDIQLETFKTITQNPVTLFTVLFIMLIYTGLAFWALHRDELDPASRHQVIVLPDNDPYDNVCYLVTVFTGSRWGSGTRADVFIQLIGTEGTSDVHCLSHPHYRTLYRGSINTFLLTTESDLGDVHTIHVWHNNEGKAPSWYLSRVKVENLFTRHIWLFMCRKWLSVDTSLDRTFHAANKEEPLSRKDFFLIRNSYELGKSHMWFSVFSSVVAKPVNRLQRLSCCLAVLLSSLLCNIMFFNANRKEKLGSKRLYYIRLMMIGIESALITVPVQLLLSFLFTYSQKTAIQMSPGEVAPRKYPPLSEGKESWEDRLKKWYIHEIHKEQTKKSRKRTSEGNHKRPRASSQSTSKPQGQPGETETKTGLTQDRNRNLNSNNENILFEESPSEETPKFKQKIFLPWWCIYIAWFLIIAICGTSSFLIVFYGLTYGYDLSLRWLFTSACSFFQSIFLVQTSKIMLLSCFKTQKTKYHANIPWTSKYQYTELKLGELQKTPAEKQKQHLHIKHVQGTRMYQPLTEDEIRIFRRRKKIKRRALLFLSSILTHFIFLGLLLGLLALLRHDDSFYYNRFIWDYFSVDLGSVTKLEHIYRWLNKVVVPLFHNDLNPTFLFDSSSKILGLPLMRQVRAMPNRKKCLSDKNLVLNDIKWEIQCHPEYGIDPEDTQNYSSSWQDAGKQATGMNPNGFIYQRQEKKWMYHSYGLLHTYGPGGYVFYFFPDQQQFNSTLRLKELKDGNWLDEKTWAVILELTTFNPDVNLFCSISVIFEVSQIGIVNSSASVHSFALSDFKTNHLEISLCLAILLFFLAYIINEGHVIVEQRTSYVRSGYNLLNLVLKCLFAVLIALLFRKYLLTTDIITFYLSHPQDFIPFHAVSQVDRLMRIVLGFLLFLTILKTLKYARIFYNVRLAQRTIQIALLGICHMAFLVSVYFFIYVAFGYLVFGQHEWNYSTLIHATQTVFSYCTSAFQNTEFSRNWILEVLSLASFVLIIICTLTNLFRAVILSAFEEMKQPVYEEPSEEVEAITYLCHKLRLAFRCLTFQTRSKDDPEFATEMLYGQPEKNNHRYLGLKTRIVNGKKMVYLVV
ncbi:PREDICTED: polycystic kidney disease and receptor for egg jelly-related protein [Elephantulus edwardii]|uniref:polycystic kidney disease and receptor for egg jelly-related protein n=1 Tax=Elephantulus edwardii TaxID=28737 RepID=UPI0003F085BF|nr:PREDICTED: polycystic kidney disease and receptor for egg jelly-related protein [Elephantulus edwardii]